MRALAHRGITAPFPIQEASLPDSLAGRDVLGRGRTGSGKTVAFALPLVQRLSDARSKSVPKRPRALILVPTRELAVQVHETVDDLAKAVKLRAMTVFGGVRYTGQVRRLERGVDIVIATPGRLLDLIRQNHLGLDRIEAVVLDEADLMADMGFLPAVTEVLEAVPAGGQRLLFSATLDGDVQGLVDRFLTDPLVHEVAEDENAPIAEHYLLMVNRDNKRKVLHELLTGGGRTLAFARTKSFAETLAAELTEAGIPARDLHGNLKQAKRQRNLSDFADGTVSVLVATDIAARGIHVDNVGLVVHVDPPNDPKAFLHRSGRTARAGAEGRVVTLALRHENRKVRSLMQQVDITPITKVVKPGDEILTELRAPVVDAESTPSIFEPDPDDAIELDEPEFRPGHRRQDRPHREDRPARKGKFGRRKRFERDERPARSAREDRLEQRSYEERSERQPKKNRGAGKKKARWTAADRRRAQPRKGKKRR